MKDQNKSISSHRRNGEIDVFRFVFSLIIVALHFGLSFDKNWCTNGAIGVEFFFIVSGYFLARTVNKELQTSRIDEVGNATWRYTVKKAKSFFPYYLGAILFQVIFRYIILKRKNIFTLFNGFIRSIPTFSLSFMGLTNSNGVLTWYVPNTWFLSALLIGGFILFPLLYKKFDIVSKIVSPLVFMFIIGYSYITTKTVSFGSHDGWNGICLNGVIRAVADLSLGIGLYPLSDVLRKKYMDSNIHTKVIITVLKAFCYSMIVVFAFGLLEKDYSLHALLFCAIGVLLSLSEIGYTIPDGYITRFLGRISLPIFIFHGIMRKMFEEMYQNKHLSNFKIVLLAGGSIVVSIILMFIIDQISKFISIRNQKKRRA